MTDEFGALITRLREFAHAREWERFHSPKNLAMALTGETGELVTLFQWLTESESVTAMRDPELAGQIRDELADVFIYLIRLADVLDVDLLAAANHKTDRNETRFPPIS